ncbi:recombinase family protein [Paracoccus versutus]|uniref:recombinase family protein n=1 Tax=Paracoccus versutus TaxID=34007 RepID=UPI0035A6FB5C
MGCGWIAPAKSGGSLVRLVEGLGKRRVGLQSLTVAVDTTSSGRRLVFHIMAALAECEWSFTSERTRAGMLTAKQRGKHIGRPRLLSEEKIHEA